MKMCKGLCFLLTFMANLLIALSISSAVNADTCQTKCIESCRGCTRIFGKMLCSPPVEPCLSTCLIAKGFRCGVDATHRDQPFHGNYCGLGNRGGPPVDSLDAACKRHDDCYDRIGRAACSCDKKLASEAAFLVTFGSDLDTSGREKAALTASFFGSTPCVPK
jgi:hypothetical protein